MAHLTAGLAKIAIYIYLVIYLFAQTWYNIIKTVT